MRENKYHLNNSEGEKEYCECGSLLKCEHELSHNYYDEEGLYTQFNVFKVLVCPACESVTILLYIAEEWISPDDEEEETEQEKLAKWLFRSYERRVLYAPKKRLHHSVPYFISEVANQAEAVLATSPRASFILCRAVLEEICTDFKIPTKKLNRKGDYYFINLKDRLLQLFDQESLSEGLKPIIEVIRELGNEGAHSDHLTFSSKLETQDAQRLLMLIEYVLERLYVDKYRQQEAMELLNKLKGKISSSEIG
jgi:Domain of unknown function (DUF4145)